jgi:transketolase
MREEKKATRESYGEALKEKGTENKNIVVLDSDLAGATKSNIFKKEFPERFFDMGISEQDMIGTAAGMAACGKIPFASTFAVFAAGRAYDQIRNSVCYPNLNVKVCGSHAGITVGEDGATHQMLEDIALMRALPNMMVFSPCDDRETKEIIKAISKIDNPCYVRLGRAKAPRVYEENLEYGSKINDFQLGKIIRLGDGTDCTIIATGNEVQEALMAQEILKGKGIDVRVLDVHTIKPLDREEIIKAAKETKKIITIEDHNIIGGLGSCVCEVLSENYPTQVIRIGINDTFGTSGRGTDLMKYFGITAEDIVKQF